LTSFNATLRKFNKTFKESLMALAFNIFGLVAGTTMALQLGLFEFAPWTIAVYPAILSARGVIAGLLSGRLSTGLHIGTVQPRFFGNTKTFYVLIQSIVVITLEISALMSVIAALFGSFLWSSTVVDFVNILSVILATMTLSLVVITPLTVTVSSLSFRHGLDPDVVLYPVESTVSDILVTLCYFLVLNLFISYDSVGRYLIVLLGLVLIFAVAYILPKDIRETEFVKTIRESVLTLILVAFIVNVTGSVLGKISEVIGGRHEIYTAYPALIDTIGDVGAVVGSTATTKLALGTLKSTFSAVRNHATEIFAAWTASLILFAAYSFLSLVIQGIFSLSTFLTFTALLFTTNLMAASSIIIVAYVVAILTFQRGLDPDNFVIPIESSLADGITTISLLAALSLIG
jgi:mgtE-like transporter